MIRQRCNSNRVNRYIITPRSFKDPRGGHHSGLLIVQGIVIKILGTACVLLVCTIVALLALSRFENPTNTFADYSEMAASETMAAGWIPKVIPRSAYEIFETHNLDNNKVNISFKFEPGDHGVAERDCQPPAEQEKQLVFLCRAGALRLDANGQGYFESN